RTTMLSGVWTALVTPFRDGAVDETAFRRLVESQVRAGAAGVIVCGSTGEAATLERSERDRVVAIAIETCRGSSTEAWVGTGTNSTAASVELTRAAAAAGALGAMIVAPFYNKPTQEGLFRHFEAVARASDLPLIAYNVPGRTGVNIAPETVARLCTLRRYV